MHYYDILEGMYIYSLQIRWELCRMAQNITRQEEDIQNTCLVIGTLVMTKRKCLTKVREILICYNKQRT